MRNAKHFSGKALPKLLAVMCVAPMLVGQLLAQGTLLQITTNAVLPDAPLAVPYSVALAATGGVSPYIWISQGRLPAGLSLSRAGVISGTPIALGTVSFTVQVTDSFTPQQQAVRTFSITVASILSISTASLPNALQNSPYSQQFQNVGGTAPFTWTVTRGVLPAGLTLTTGGMLQGTPRGLESQSVDVTVADSQGPPIKKRLP